MSIRELVILGTSSQAPTKTRNHNGYLLRWDTEGILFDPGEGTQRQMTHAGITATGITRLCLTHFHGDHCLGVPGIVQRLSLDRVSHPVEAYYPASGQDFFHHLRHASAFHETTELRENPIDSDGIIAKTAVGTLCARRLDHPVDTIGYQWVEPDGRRMLPVALQAYGITGPDIGKLQHSGIIETGGRRVTLDEVSEIRIGQRFAFIMDTRLCDAVFALADKADLLIIESTFLESEAPLAADFGHMTAAQAARVAAECGVRRLVLTHFSQRYTDPTVFLTEAEQHYTGEIILAEDLTHVPVPRRQYHNKT